MLSKKVAMKDSWAGRNPHKFTLLLILALELLLLALLGAARVFAPQLPLEALDLPLMLVQTALPLIVIAARGWWSDVGFTRPRDWQNLSVLLFPLALYLVVPLVFRSGDWPAGPALIAIAVVALLVGLQEEMVFRGLIVGAFLPSGVLRAAMWSAFWFGVIHFNSLLVGRDPMFVLSQVVASMLGGFGIAALRIRTNSIVPLIFLHAFNDWLQFAFLGGMQAETVPTYFLLLKVGFSLIIGLYGAYLLRDQWMVARKAEAV